MRILTLIALSCIFPLLSFAAPATSETFSPVPYDPFVGDWLPKKTGDYVAQVIATGGNAYQANVLVAFDDESSGAPVVVLHGTRPDEKSTVELSDASGDWTGAIRPDCCGSPQMEIANSKTREKVRLSQFMRPNPRLRAKPPEGAVVLFGDLMRDGGFTLAKGQGTLVSGEQFENIRAHLEFRMLANESAGEVRFGRTSWIGLCPSYARNDVAVCGLMNGVAPTVRAERALLEWQALDIEMTSATIKVLLNGVLIHDVARPSDSPADRALLEIKTTGEPVEFRNVWALQGGNLEIAAPFNHSGSHTSKIAP